MLNRRTDILLTMLMVLTTLTGCKDYDDPIDGNETEGVSLAFNVSTSRVTTRMSDAVTQQPGTTYRGIKDQYLFPFDIRGLIGTDEKPLSGRIETLPNYEHTTHYFDDKSVSIPNETASFLCYANAKPGTGGKFVNGSIISTITLGEDETTTSDISFAPEVIHNSVDIDTKASKIADYLTDIANAIKAAKKNDLFRQFINEGHLVACSSTNVERLAAWASSQEGVTMPTAPDDIIDYPTDIYLPEGAATVKWNYTEEKFEPQTVTTTEANINRLDRFIYPAELWYYANSRIKTSSMSQKSSYSKTDWADVLANYDSGYGVMGKGVLSVAINDPLSYAVGCLQIGLTVGGNSLTDAEGKAVPLVNDETSQTFPLTAVFVSGQHEQAFDFTPKNDNNECIIYDKDITGISMGAANAATPTKCTNTLVLQTLNGENVRFALEFTNNSGQDFQGANGIVFNGTKFYLVGTIEVPTGQTDDYKKRAFTKNYITKGVVNISSLKQTYTYLPDLLDPRLEIAIKLTPDWILSTPTNVPL